MFLLIEASSGQSLNHIQIMYFSDEWREIVDKVINILVPQKVGNFLKSWATVDSEGRDLLHEFT
jgi:hypothetical protein